MSLFIKDKSFYKSVFTLVLPIALQNLIVVGLGMADTLMLGMVSGDALSGSSLGNVVYFVYALFIFGLSSGASILTAQYWGKNDTEAISRVLGIALRSSAIVAILFSAVVISFPAQVISLFIDDPGVIDAGARFLRIIGFSFIFTSFTMTYVNIIRSVEIVRISLLIYSASFTVNVFLNWVLIFGNLGAPALGIEGSAIATLTARIMEFTVTMIYALRFNKRLKLKLSNIFRRGGVLSRDFAKYSIPVVLNETLWALGISMQTVVLGHLSAAAIEANAVAKVFQQLEMVLAFGVASATAVIVGKTIGARDEPLARKTANTLLLLSVIIGLVSGGLLLLSVPFILNLYPLLSALAKEYLWYMLTTMACYCVFQSFNCASIIGVLRGGGDAKFGLYIDVGTLWGVSLVLGYVGGYVFGWPIPLVFIALCSDELIKLVLGVLRIKSGVWLSNVTRELSIDN